MGWFEDQIKERKKLDDELLQESFKSLSGMEVKNLGDMSEKVAREDYAISQILSYFKHQMVDIPSGIKDFNDKLNYALGQYDVQYRKIMLDDAYAGDYKCPLVIFTILSNSPVVIFPKGPDKYYYFDYETGKKKTIEAKLVNRLELEALSFYRALPTQKISIKEYVGFISRAIRPSDIALVLILSAIATGVGLLLPYLTKLLTGDVVDSKDMNQLVTVSMFLIATVSGMLLINTAKTYINSRVVIRIDRSVQEAAMMRLLNLPTSFFKKYNTGELSARFSSIGALANLIVKQMSMTLLSFIMSMAYLVQLVSLAPVLIVPVILIQSVSLAFTVYVAFVQKDYSQRVLELSSKEDGVTYGMINGIQKIRLAGAEKRAFAKWTKVYLNATKVTYNPPLVLKLSSAISLLITLVGSILLYYMAAENGIGVGNYMAFITSYGLITAAFLALGQMIGTIFSIRPLFEMARPILTTEPENNINRAKVESVTGNIALKDVSFRYGEDGPMILDGLSLDIKEGEFLAIVGRSGCGKSTLVRLLLGFEKPVSGEVLYDGRNIEDLDLPSLRRNIGSVIQNGNLLHADILSNIIITSPDLKEEDAWRAAEIAGIADDIRAMPMGMKTIISEGQGGISGGQKQKIMIARAIVHRPKILIFDEATSALDNKTQKRVTESIQKLNCTRVVIAHRLSTIMNADRIIMLEGGRIVEEGDYRTLIDMKGRFADLVDRQRLDSGERA